MDRWIRYGLAIAWVGFALAMLLWWWRRSYSTRRYSYSERASIIHEAMQQSADLGVIYWSKSQKTFLRRIITPLELEGYTLRAFDHNVNDVRIFKVTRIKTVEVVPRGSEKLPLRLSVSGAIWTLAGLGVAAITLLAVALYRGRETATGTSWLPPSSTNVPSSSLSTSRFVIANAATTNATNATSTNATLPDGTGPTTANTTSTDVTLPDVSGPIATSAPPVIKASADQWGVVVYDQTTYDTNFVATALHRLVNCSPAEAEKYTRQIRTQGHAPVWFGRWTQAEVLRQTLEAEDIVAKVEVIEPPKSPDSAPPK